MNDIIVWGFRWAPPFAQGLVRDLRVRWALEEAGLSYTTRLIDFDARNSAEYLRRQPFGQIPAFEADGHGLFESGAIVHRIAAESATLLPASHDERADAITWMFAALNTVEPPIQNLLALDLQHGDEEWARLRRPGVVAAVTTRLDALAGWLAAREYLLDRFTAADILMTTVLRLIRHTDLVAGYATLAAYVERCEQRPAFRRALDDQLTDYARHAPASHAAGATP